jgi:acetolactate synthase-1/3 small subunit
MKSYVLSVIVDNNPGVLTRVCALFNRRGYNLDSVTAGVTENERISRLTLTSSGEEDEIEQIIKQIRKLEDVHKVVLLDSDNSVCKEIMFIKVKAEGANRQEIINLVNIFRASIVDVTPDTLTAEITGDSNKLAGFENLLVPFGILEVVSSGFIAIQRGNEAI